MSVVGLGTDIVEIARFSDETRRDKLAKRVLTEQELAEYQAHAMPERYLAKRFAAKEAAVKAFGTGIGSGVSWQQLQVNKLPSGQPALEFIGYLVELAEKMGVTSSCISISDEQHYAVATVILQARS